MKTKPYYKNHKWVTKAQVFGFVLNRNVCFKYVGLLSENLSHTNTYHGSTMWDTQTHTPPMPTELSLCSNYWHGFLREITSLFFFCQNKVIIIKNLMRTSPQHTPLQPKTQTMPTLPVSWGASLRGQLSFVLGCHWLKSLTQTPGLGMLLPLSRVCYGTSLKLLFKVGNFSPI